MALPGRHVVLGLRLAELPHGAGQPLGADVPAAAHLPLGRALAQPAVVSLHLLCQTHTHVSERVRTTQLIQYNIMWCSMLLLSWHATAAAPRPFGVGEGSVGLEHVRFSVCVRILVCVYVCVCTYVRVCVCTCVCVCV